MKKFTEEQIAELRNSFGEIKQATLLPEVQAGLEHAIAHCPPEALRQLANAAIPYVSVMVMTHLVSQQNKDII